MKRKLLFLSSVLATQLAFATDTNPTLQLENTPPQPEGPLTIEETPPIAVAQNNTESTSSSHSGDSTGENAGSVTASGDIVEVVSPKTPETTADNVQQPEPEPEPAKAQNSVPPDAVADNPVMSEDSEGITEVVKPHDSQAAPKNKPSAGKSDKQSDSEPTERHLSESDIGWTAPGKETQQHHHTNSLQPAQMASAASPVDAVRPMAPSNPDFEPPEE